MSDTITAWMGFDPKNLGAVRVCAWCSDKATAGAMAKARGLQVTHGICPTCAQRMAAQVTGDRSDDFPAEVGRGVDSGSSAGVRTAGRPLSSHSAGA